MSPFRIFGSRQSALETTKVEKTNCCSLQHESCRETEDSDSPQWWRAVSHTQSSTSEQLPDAASAEGFGHPPREAKGLRRKKKKKACVSVARERHRDDLSAIGLPEWLVNVCSSVQIYTATAVQAKALPVILQRSHKNTLVSSPTGSGKTACYCWPILIDLAKDPFGIHSLVLLPSRELAVQVYEQFLVFGKFINLLVKVVLGGVNSLTQRQALAAGPHVVIATPGRLSDILEDTDISHKLKYLRTLVLDEVDQLIESSFDVDLRSILRLFVRNEDMQTLCFTATAGDAVKTRLSLLCKKPFEFVDVNSVKRKVSKNLLQRYVLVNPVVRLAYLHTILSSSDMLSTQGIIFTATCRGCQHLVTTLEGLQYSVTCLHSLQDQKRRLACLAKFRSETARLLVATDVASRGLDIPKVGFVINFDFPSSFDSYIHRVGRTARAGRKGEAISFVTKKDVKTVPTIEDEMQAKLELLDTEESEVLKRLAAVTKAEQKAAVLLHEIGFEEKADLAHLERAHAKLSRKKQCTSKAASLNVQQPT